MRSRALPQTQQGSESGSHYRVLEHEQVFGTVPKMSLGIPASHAKVPGFTSQLCS